MSVAPVNLPAVPSALSPEANLRREIQSRVVQGQPRAGDTVTTRPRPNTGERGSHDSPDANPGRKTHSRLV